VNTLIHGVSIPPASATLESRGHSAGETGVWIAVAAVSFYLAYLSSLWAWSIGVYVFAMAQLCHTGAPRRAFYSGLAVGLLLAVGQLAFFWRLFSFSAIALWVVYAFWLGLFALVGSQCVNRFPRKISPWLLPVLWCGMEYFRSELYYLRFSWLTPGMAFGLEPSWAPIGLLGIYGVGFALMALGSGAAALWKRTRVTALLVLGAGLALFCSLSWISRAAVSKPARAALQIAGVQLEFPTEKEVLVWLTQLGIRHPEARLLVLSEYTFDQPPPEAVKSWCREHGRYLIVGGKEPAGSGQFYNTAYVIGPTGEIVFRQAKSVPIQFFKDGLPAPNQQLWNSPWGKLGICICYDLSYARVTDRLVSMGAEALIVPTMDVAEWGKRQHELHGRVGPLRAAEYHIPIFRLASSGISQAISASGRVLASAPYPGNASMLAASLPLSGEGRVPFDRRPALACVIGTAVLILATLLPQRAWSKTS
jgi:apolipoprotein N-acyltransferase